MLKIRHQSDCALHNAPALEPQPCDCGGEERLLAWIEQIVRRGNTLLEAIKTETPLTLPASDFKVGLALLQESVIKSNAERQEG